MNSLNRKPLVNTVNSDTPDSGAVVDCAVLVALIPDYAFGLSDPTETYWIESHLADCAEAGAALADYRQMQSVMRTDVPQLAPPAALGSRLMAMAAANVPQAPAMPIATITPVAPKPVTRPRPNRLTWLLAAAVILLVASNAFWLLRANGNGAIPATTIPTAAPNPAFVLNTTSTIRWVHLPASQQTAKASAYLLWNADSKIGLLYVHDFPQLAAGQTYQLWLTRGTAHLSVGTFTVDANGKGALLFSTESIDQYTWARITTEPLTGSDTPDGTVVVVGQL